MQPISPANDLPRCRGRLATIWPQIMAWAFACVLLWPATASSQPSPRESEFQFVGPAGRPQQRLASELRILGETPEIDWEPLLQIASKWGQRFYELNLTALEQPLAIQAPEDVEENAAQQSGEEIDAGQPQRDRCFVGAPLSTVSVNIAPPSDELPENVAAICRQTTPQRSDTRLTCGWAVYEKRWAATCMHHRPLYFEEVNAERYGYTPCHCGQPLISAGRFLATIPALPYLMVARPPGECIYTLGHYRPGDCAPYRWHHPPRCVAAGVFEAAVVVGLVALVP